VSTYDAIVPAGGTIDANFASLVGTEEKALIQLGERTILETILTALKESGRIRNIVVVGSENIENAAQPFGVKVIRPGESGPENIFRGLDALKEMDPALDKALIVTCDLPFLTAESVQNYIDRCPENRDVCVPVIEAEEFNRKYPGTSSTFVRTKDGVFTIGGMFLMNAKKMPSLRSQIESVFARRKSKLGMAMLIGPVFVYKWLSKSLTLRDLERKIESMLGCTGSAVRNVPVELAYDVDYQDDYEYAIKYVEART
jgi:molybdopterin-guanine dinucleotide biosynthesis protein A